MAASDSKDKTRRGGRPRTTVRKSPRKGATSKDGPASPAEMKRLSQRARKRLEVEAQVLEEMRGLMKLAELPSYEELADTSAKKRVLQGLRNFGTWLEACQWAGIGYSTARLWREKVYPRHRDKNGEWVENRPNHNYDPEFVLLAVQALDEFKDTVQTEVRRRAIEGWEEPVFGRGAGQGAGTEVVGTVTKYSDRLLELLAKRVDPEFRERAAQVNVQNNNTNEAPHQDIIDLKSLTPEQQRLMLKILELESAKAEKEDQNSRAIEGTVIRGGRTSPPHDEDLT